MDFSGPVAADYRNVNSLNTAFLSLLRNSAAGASSRSRMTALAGEQIRALTDLQLERLAACPFLLLSFRENDQGYWRALVEDQQAADLLHEASPPAQERIAASGLAFLWQLAQRSHYAVRLVSAGDALFCERLTDLTIVRLLKFAARRNDVVLPRFAEDPAVWEKLLGPGISPTPRVRLAAQVSVLQGMLTVAAPEPRQDLRAAACAAPLPVARVVGKPVRP
jgi:hypothetical protein